MSSIIKTAILTALITMICFGILIRATENRYSKMNCAQYVSAMHHHSPQTARAIWNGEDQNIVGEYDSFPQAEISGQIREGDVIAFHGVHVAWYHNGAYLDSDPNHNGPGRMQYNGQDGWFEGPVRIVRYR
jgi:hypothetical protein